MAATIFLLSIMSPACISWLCSLKEPCLFIHCIILVVARGKFSSVHGKDVWQEVKSLFWYSSKIRMEGNVNHQGAPDLDLEVPFWIQHITWDEFSVRN